jgi:NitT/TauT family transport system substrate-binding protein
MKRYLMISLLLLTVLLIGCSAESDSTDTDNTIAIRAAFPSTPDIDDVSLLIAFERLIEQGIVIEPTFFAQGELAAVALAGGESELGSGSATVWLTAIEQGAPIIGTMENYVNGWSVMAVNEIASCADLDGMRVAIHSEGSVSTAMLRAWIDQTCPGSEPQFLVIPGSENRAAALMAGEIDATPSELIDAIRIDALQPGKFHRVADFAVDLPGLHTGGLWMASDWAAENPEIVQSIVQTVLEVQREVVDNPEWFVEQVPNYLDIAEAELPLLPAIVDAMLAIDSFPVNGGLTMDGAQGTLDFFTEAGRLDGTVSAEKAYDLSYLNQVIDEIGRQ